MSSTVKVDGAGGASHTFSEEEKMAFATHVNVCLGDDTLMARHLPLDPCATDLFDRTYDGILFCQLINLAVPNTIDVRAINKKDTLSIFQKIENLNLALNGARSIGCQVVNIGAQDIIEGRPVQVLGLIWQIIRIQLLSPISLKHTPELVVLLNEDEELTSGIKLSPEAILLRWVNYHLERGNCTRRMTNFGVDVKDGEIYSVLINQLDALNCPLIPSGLTPVQRASQVIHHATAMDAKPFIHAEDIVNGNKKLNMGFVAQLFHTCHCLHISEKEVEAVKMDLRTLAINEAALENQDATDQVDPSGCIHIDKRSQNTKLIRPVEDVEHFLENGVAAEDISFIPFEKAPDFSLDRSRKLRERDADAAELCTVLAIDAIPRVDMVLGLPTYLPQSAQDCFWVEYEKNEVFDCHNPKYCCCRGDSTWVLYWDVPAGKKGIPPRNTSWFELGKVTEFPLFLPAGDPRSKWVCFLDEIAFKYIPHFTVCLCGDVYWVQIATEADVPTNEPYFSVRELTWVEKYGIVKLPNFLPRCDEGAVWVPYPDSCRVPPETRYDSLRSGDRKDGMYWLCQANADSVQGSEKYFKARNESYADLLGISELPFSLPIGPPNSVWVPYPDEATVKALNTSFYPGKSQNRVNVYWVLHCDVSDVPFGEHFFYARLEPYLDLMGIEVLPRWLPMGPPDAVWTIYPDEETFQTMTLGLVLFAAFQGEAVWAMHTNVTQLPEECSFGVRTSSQVDDMEIVKLRPEFASMTAVPNAMWVVFRSLESIAPGTAYCMKHFLDSQVYGNIKEHWVLVPDSEAARRICPFDKTFPCIPIPDHPILEKYPTEKWSMELPALAEGRWFVYKDKVHFDGAPGSYFPSQIYTVDGYYIVGRSDDIEDTTHLVVFDARRENYSTLLKIKEPPSSLPRGVKGCRWSPFDSADCLKYVVPDLSLGSTIRDNVLWVLFGDGRHIPSGSSHWACKTDAFADELEISHLPDDLPRSPFPDSRWIPLPDNSFMGSDSSAVFPKHGVYWTLFKSYDALNVVYFGEKSFPAVYLEDSAGVYSSLVEKMSVSFKQKVEILNKLYELQPSSAVVLGAIAKKVQPEQCPILVQELLKLMTVFKKFLSSEFVDSLLSLSISEWTSFFLQECSSLCRKLVAQDNGEEIVEQLLTLNQATDDCSDGQMFLDNSVLDGYRERLSRIVNRTVAICTWTNVNIRHFLHNKEQHEQTEILAVIVHCIFLTSGYYPRNMQLLSLLFLIDNTGLIGEMQTGEGKSDVIKMFAAFKTLNGHFVDIVTSPSILAIRDANDSAPFFEKLNLTVTHNCDRNCTITFQSDIVYGDANSFQLDVLDDLYFNQDRRRGRPFDVVVVDEVDSMFLDEGGFVAAISKKNNCMELHTWLYHFIWNIIERDTTVDTTHNEVRLLVNDALTKNDIRNLVPSCHSAYFDHLFETWPGSAHSAKHQFERDVDYIALKEEGIKPVVAGVIQKESAFSNGVHEFITIKEHMDITKPENIVAAFISNVSYLKMYNGIYGMTGMIGDTNEKTELRDLYNVKFFKMPNYQENIIIYYDSSLYWYRAQWYQAIKDSIMIEVEKERPVLVIFESILLAQLFVKMIQDSNDLFEFVEINGIETDLERNARIIQAGFPKCVCIATNLAVHGLNIVPSQESLHNNGLHVILTYIEKNNRMENQAFGRTGRGGHPGSVELIACEQNATIRGVQPEAIEQFIIARNDKYKVNSIFRHKYSVPMTMLKDFSFRQMCQFLTDTKTLNNSTYSTLKNGIDSMLDMVPSATQLWHGADSSHWVTKDKFEAEGLKLRWVYWYACHKSQHDPNARNVEDFDAMKKSYCGQFFQFVQTLSEDIVKDNSIRDPDIFARRGNECLSKRLYEDGLVSYNSAISLDEGCYAAHYNSAIACLLAGMDGSAIMLQKGTEHVRKLIAKYKLIEENFECSEKLCKVRQILEKLLQYISTVMNTVEASSGVSLLTWETVKESQSAPEVLAEIVKFEKGVFETFELSGCIGGVVVKEKVDN